MPKVFIVKQDKIIIKCIKNKKKNLPYWETFQLRYCYFDEAVVLIVPEKKDL